MRQKQITRANKRRARARRRSAAVRALLYCSTAQAQTEPVLYCYAPTVIEKIRAYCYGLKDRNPGPRRS